MYLEHFGLRESPFRITPHTEFFFSGANRGATLDALIYAITHDEGIVKVTGEVGSGKTMLCRVLLERLPENVVTVYLATPSLTREDILYAIADELALELPPQPRPAQILRKLQDHLIELYAEGRQVVVLIDEAHVMPIETLEEIRLLSNLESNRHKLLQIVLFGQPELNDILAQTNMRQLKERITHNFGLEPLIRQDIAEYIDFRLRAAGYKGPNLFSSAAIKLITSTSQGLTRRVNILADKALLAAFSNSSHDVGTEAVKTAIKDSDFSGGSNKLTLPIVAAIALAILCVSTLLGLILMRPQPAVPAAPPVSTPSLPAPAVTPTVTATTPQTLTPPLAHPLRVAAPEPETAISKGLGKLTQTRLQAGTVWLAQTRDQHWFVQLLAADIQDAANVEHFLEKLATQLPPENTHVYLVERSNKQRLGVVYGDFENQESAQKFIAALPITLQNAKPYARPVRHLR